MISIINDLWDIIKSEPEVKKLIKAQVGQILNPSFFRKIGRRFGKKPTKKEQNDEYLQIIEQLTKSDFSAKFTDHLNYYGALLCLITGCAYINRRGVIITDFYNPDYYFYFPPPEDEPLLGEKILNNRYKGRCIKRKRPGNLKALGTEYFFYAFKKTDENNTAISINDLNKVLQNLFIAGQDQKAGFTSELQRRKIKVKSLRGIIEFNTGHRFLSEDDTETEENQIRIQLLNPTQTRESIANDLRSLIQNEIHP